MWSRIYLIPLLQAEEDRDLVRKTLAGRAMEKELLGAETKVYNSDRCVQIVGILGCIGTNTMQVCAPDVRSHTCECHEVSVLHSKDGALKFSVHNTGVVALWTLRNVAYSSFHLLFRLLQHRFCLSR